MNEDTNIPNDPQDKLNFINDIIRQTQDLLRNSFSQEDYVNSIYELVCMENDFDVLISDDSVKVSSAHKGNEEVRWAELRKVSIVTNDKGPFTADVFMVLFSDTVACAVPSGNVSYDDLYDKVTALEGVDFEAVIESAMSSENKEFVIWEKKPGNNSSALSYALFHCDPSTKPPFTLELGFSDGSVKEITNCEHIPNALEKLEEFCKTENIQRSSAFTLLYPIYLEAMDTDDESTMHNIAWLVKEQADKHKWNFDRTGGYTGKTGKDFC